jgi:uncharacterized membrane protein
MSAMPRLIHPRLQRPLLPIEGFKMTVADRSDRFDPRRSMTAAILLGIGIMAAVDEIIFHQLLAWHHFFDWSTPAFALFSDGLLHAGELILLVLGFNMMLDLRGRGALARRPAQAGFLLGLGGFQLFDGIIDHKLLRLHQVRYVEPLWPYDLAWNGFAIVLIAIGMLLARRARSERTAADAPQGR